MTTHGPHETRHVHIDVAGLGPEWVAERWGRRYLFIGPLPGRTLFYSDEHDTWDAAILEARRRWNAMDTVRRANWYGPQGRYTLGATDGNA